MFVIILLSLIALILLGSYLVGWVDTETLQALGWIATIVGVIGATLQFVFPLATPFDPNFSFELPGGITVSAGATPEPTSPPAPEPTNPPVATAQPTTPPTDNTESIISDKDGMTLLYVPEGEFEMGSADNDPDANDNEKPRHTVFLSAYWIDQTEVTNAMFAAFLNEKGNQEEGGVTWLAEEDWALIENVNGTYQPKDGYADHPVVAVSWYGANAYCQWAGRHLPTEAEWEKAAGGTDGRKWPWGNEPPNESLVNIDDYVGGTTPVGNYPAGASPYGALDMSGNVWEWCYDTFDANYYASSPNENPPGPTSQWIKVTRGGSWESSVRNSHARLRGWNADDRSSGFRCAQ